MFKVLGQHTCVADPANIERFDALARTCNPNQFLKNAERATSSFDFGESHEWASLSLTEHQRRVDLRFQARGCSLRLFRLNSLGNPFHQFVIREVASHGSTSLGIQRGHATADARSPSLSFRSSLPYRAPTLFPSNARSVPAGIVREGRTSLARYFCELVPVPANFRNQERTPKPRSPRPGRQSLPEHVIARDNGLRPCAAQSPLAMPEVGWCRGTAADFPRRRGTPPARDHLPDHAAGAGASVRTHKFRRQSGPQTLLWPCGLFAGQPQPAWHPSLPPLPPGCPLVGSRAAGSPPRSNL